MEQKTEEQRTRTPNKTEQAAAMLFRGAWAYEASSFQICGGSKYTPDWVDADGRACIEAKGEYIHSRDSRLRFDEARHLHPDWTWIWARQRTKGRKGPRWEVEIYQPGASVGPSCVPN